MGQSMNMNMNVYDKEQPPFHDKEGKEEDYVKDGSLNWQNKAAKRSQTGGWRAAFFIIGMEVAERIAFVSIVSNLVQYLSLVMKESLTESVKSTYNWSGVTKITPFVGGFVADTYLGCPLTVAICSVIYLLGMIILTISTSIDFLKPPCLKDPSKTCGAPTTYQVGIFFCGLYLISIGTGGVKPCLQALGADQFPEENIEKKARKSSFFNWWNVGVYSGVLLAITVMVYIQTNIGWNVGFFILTALMGLGTIIFFVGMPFYRHKAIHGSPITNIMQVIGASIRKHNVQVPTNENLLYEVQTDSMQVATRQIQHSKKFKFLDKAATPTSFDFSHDMGEMIERVNPWRLCTVTQVEEVKLLLQVIPVWLTTLTFGIFLAQFHTLFVKQAAMMDTRIKKTNFYIPPASIGVFSVLTTIMTLPIYEFLLVPLARAKTGHARGITLLQRIGIGYFLSIVCMLVAAIIETKRLRVANEGKKPLRIFWLTPQNFISGICDLFVLVGEQEFFYDQVPDNMRSLGMALYLATIGIGSFLSTFLMTLVEHITKICGSKSWFGHDLNSSHLDYYYWLLVLFGVINLLGFFVIAHFYQYKKPKSIYLNNQG